VGTKHSIASPIAMPLLFPLTIGFNLLEFWSLSFGQKRLQKSIILNIKKNPLSEVL
jgi:hypothetical protein